MAALPRKLPGSVPPAEARATYSRRLAGVAMVARLTTTSLRKSWGSSAYAAIRKRAKDWLVAEKAGRAGFNGPFAQARTLSSGGRNASA